MGRLFHIACVLGLLAATASADGDAWTAIHGDWRLRIDGGGEIYFARLRLAPSEEGGSRLPVAAAFEADGHRGRVASAAIESGFYVVEVETRRSGMPAKGLFAFELVDGRLTGDVDFESGSGVRSYEFQAERLGAGPAGASAPNAGGPEPPVEATATQPSARGAASQATKRIVLRQGDGGYAGAVDTEIWAIAPSKPLDRQGTMTADGNNGGGESQVLMRFGDLIGDGDKQVPEGSRVVAATLRIVVFDPGTTVYLHRVLAPWGASSTWDGMAAGVSVDGVEASPVRDGFNFGQINMDRQEVQFDVTQTVQAWADGEPNRGWVFVNTGGNGWDFYSSDWIEEDLRPSLEVVAAPR
ncbi:DNRLRE domain-containing protein [Botrimarina sp.]|uniref:DNRLRE domain-containing protein n=1 Tax=Botrimarina sp. TaxID=2795802 RepID=UPI0032F01415